jgi:hypothetical protein
MRQLYTSAQDVIVSSASRRPRAARAHKKHSVASCFRTIDPSSINYMSLNLHFRSIAALRNQQTQGGRLTYLRKNKLPEAMESMEIELYLK